MVKSQSMTWLYSGGRTAHLRIEFQSALVSWKFMVVAESMRGARRYSSGVLHDHVSEPSCMPWQVVCGLGGASS